MNVVVIDTGISNLLSVMNAIRRVGISPSASAEPAVIEAADILILPGVGAFQRAMDGLRSRGLVDVLRCMALQKKVPMLGICLGMQLMADESDEQGRHAGLGLVRARVERLDPAGSDCRVPNIGWCDVKPTRAGVLFPDPSESRSFYFVHSYHVVCENSDVAAAQIKYGQRDVTVALEYENIFGCQFHPEKSQEAGLDLIDRFFRQVHRRQ